MENFLNGGVDQPRKPATYLKYLEHASNQHLIAEVEANEQPLMAQKRFTRQNYQPKS